MSAGIDSVIWPVSGDWLPDAADAAQSPTPATFEDLGHLGALMRYDVSLPADTAGALVFEEVRDLAWVLVDGRFVGRLSRSLHERALQIPAGGSLTVLIEEQGRVNYDKRLGEQKGLIAPVTLDGAALTGWRATPIDLDAVHAEIAASAPGSDLGRSGLRAAFDLDQQSDLFLDTANLGKGFAFVNGFLLGRYWVNGPQRTMYVPAPVTRVGRNDLVIVELEQASELVARFVPTLLLGHVEE